MAKIKMKNYISIKTYSSLTEVSERTVRRYISMKEIAFLFDELKNKTLIATDELEKNCSMALSIDDISLIIEADSGDSDAQTDLSLLCLEHSRPNIALHWLNLAVKQGHSDAMHLLGQCYLSGNGIAKDKNLAMTWISKAATLGHQIALKQMDGLHFD
jgi:TPR repeat protein